jgi:hypothetical protein
MASHTTNSIVQMKPVTIGLLPAFSKTELLSVGEIEKRRQTKKNHKHKK